MQMTPTADQNKAAREKIKYSARGEIIKLPEKEVKLSNFSTKKKKPGIVEVPIYVCVGVSHS